jgi:ATP-dependent Clp protease, protease subunit
MKLNKFYNSNEKSTTEEGGETETPQGFWTPQSLAGFGPATRTVLIGGEIENIMGSAICSQIEFLAAESDAPIKVVINSPGGDVVQTLAIYDTLRAIDCPIITVVQGMAYSGGFLLSQAGDLRIAFPNARLFYHEPISEFQIFSGKELESHAKSYSWGLDVMNELIKKRTKINKSKWSEFFAGKTSIYFTAAEAKALNIIDDIIEYQKKPKIKLEGI